LPSRRAARHETRSPAPDAEYFFYANVVMRAILGNYLVGQISLVLIAPLIAGVVLLAFKKG